MFSALLVIVAVLVIAAVLIGGVVFSVHSYKSPVGDAPVVEQAVVPRDLRWWAKHHFVCAADRARYARMPVPRPVARKPFTTAVTGPAHVSASSITPTPVSPGTAKPIIASWPSSDPIPSVTAPTPQATPTPVEGHRIGIRTTDDSDIRWSTAESEGSVWGQEPPTPDGKSTKANTKARAKADKIGLPPTDDSLPWTE